jgi:hypothetical protein
MHIVLGKGDVEIGAVRLANGGWALLLQKHDKCHEVGTSANSVDQVYVPTDRDVVIELGSEASARVLQDALNHAVLFHVGLIPPRPSTHV